MESDFNMSVACVAAFYQELTWVDVGREWMRRKAKTIFLFPPPLLSSLPLLTNPLGSNLFLSQSSSALEVQNVG